MATSVDQLLADAQRQMWQAAQPVPLPPQRGTAAARQRTAHLQAWPTLATAARHALGADLIPAPDHGAAVTVVPKRLVATLRLLERTATVLQPARPDLEPAGDRQMRRVAQLLAAVGDVLRDQAPTDRDSGTTDRILDLVAAAATLTAAYTGQASPSGRARDLQQPAHWLALSSAARQACTTVPGQRDTAAAMRPIVPTGEQSLDADLAAFHRAATDALTPTRAPTTDLWLIPRVLAAVHRTAAAYDTTGLHRPAADAWREAANAWLVVRIPGPPHSALRETARVVAATLATDLDPHDQAAVHLFAQDQAADLAAGYLHHVRDDVDAWRYAVAARHLLKVMDPAPTELLRPGRLGHWVSLPPVSPPSSALLDTAHAAADARAYQTLGAGSAPAAELRPAQPARPRPGAHHKAPQPSLQPAPGR